MLLSLWRTAAHDSGLSGSTSEVPSMPVQSLRLTSAAGTNDFRNSAGGGFATRWGGLLQLVGAAIILTGAAMVPAAIVSTAYGERRVAVVLIVAALVTQSTGFVLWRRFREAQPLSVVKAFGAVGFAWFAMATFGAIPFMMTGEVPGLTDAFFESASGFTATGSSVVADLPSLSHGILFWRALTQWIGGMGVVVLAIALLPLLGVGAVQLARAEAPGPTPERLTPRFQNTAKRLWVIYVGFTVIQIVLLQFGDMDLFESATHSFATISGGGFGTRPDSMGAFSAYSQWVVIVFMIAGGTSFALHHRAIRNPLAYLRNAEFRLYVFTFAAFSAAAAVGTWGGSAEATIRNAAFTTSSILTTTGFASTDFGLWRPVLQLMVLGLMFVGAMAGSTSGSLKVFRIEALWNAVAARLRSYLHPSGVFIVRSGGEPLADEAVRSIRVLATLYLFCFMTGTLLLGFIVSLAGSGLSVVSITSAVAASLGNIGPGLDMLGPADTFAEVPAMGKWLLATLMIVGRLEVLPVLLLLTREFWKR